jgi:hypothetical protein
VGDKRETCAQEKITHVEEKWPNVRYIREKEAHGRR